MEFEKINVSEETFKEIAKKVCWYLNDYVDIYQHKVEYALERAIFNVEAEFKEDDWNRCTVLPSKEYYEKDVLIRKRNIPTYGIKKNTARHSAYKVAFYNNATKTFISQDKCALSEDEDPRDFEYKFIS